MHYIFRCTTDQLAASLDRIVETGDRVLSEHHVGGRDWVLVCEKATA